MNQLEQKIKLQPKGFTTDYYYYGKISRWFSLNILINKGYNSCNNNLNLCTNNF